MRVAALDAPVLVLNKDWRPLQLTTGANALAELFAGKVEAVDTDYAVYDFASWAELSRMKDTFEPDAPRTVVRTVREEILVPAIIRLLRMNRSHKRCVRLSRRNIYLRDNYTCQYTGKRLPASELNLDHVIPQSRGGRSTWDNLVCCSVEVNSLKGNRTPVEAGLALIRQPRKPEPHEIALRAIRVRHPSWEAFVSEAYWNVELED
ncbi:MAG: HNH endonuclease [Rhodospirillales bacterium]|nr:HNH endonuclease [Rhodospirillales bacterium]